MARHGAFRLRRQYYRSCPNTSSLVQPFVEFFLPSVDWTKLRKKLDNRREQITYFAGTEQGDFVASDEGSVNPVTWGAFKGKE